MKLIDENSPNPELEPMDMHGPVEVSITVFAKKWNGEIGRLTFTHPSGQIPTRAELAGYLDAAQAAMPGLEAEFPSKPEFVAHLTQRETGKPIPMAGARHWVQASSEIPRGVLVHAIIGLTKDVSEEQEVILVAHGLVAVEPNSLTGNLGKLTAMTDYELEALYREVANG